MDIRYLALTFLAVSTAYYFVPVENKNINKEKVDVPQVIFENPLMYTLTTKEVSNIIKASNAVRYSSKDELYNATIYLKSKNPKEYAIEKLSADYIKKTGFNYYLKDNVDFKRDNFFNVKTSELYFDDKNKVASNSVPYNGFYYNNDFDGSHLDFRLNNNLMKSKNIHFEIDMNKGVK